MQKEVLIFMHVTIEAQVIDSNHLKLKKPTQIPPGSIVVIEITTSPIIKPGLNPEPYTLGGKPFQYSDPFGSIAENDWDTLR
jgi:hypothetical protein